MSDEYMSLYKFPKGDAASRSHICHSSGIDNFYLEGLNFHWVYAHLGPSFPTHLRVSLEGQGHASD